MVGGSVDAVLRPPSWAKEGNGSKKGREEGENRLNRRQKGKERDGGNHLGLGLVSLGSAFAVLLLRNYELDIIAMVDYLK